MKTLLVPVDFSPATESVIKVAANLARQLSARLVLLHVVPSIIATTEPVLSPSEMAALQKADEKSMHNRLTKMHAELAAAGLKVETELRPGLPAAMIVELAGALSADFVVMGSHGHTALYDLLLGSTTHSVLKHAACPVVIVPQNNK